MSANVRVSRQEFAAADLREANVLSCILSARKFSGSTVDILKPQAALTMPESLLL
jgi:hypothetical protein